MYIVYILKSENFNRYYIGHTADLNERLKKHNNGRVKSTKAYKPWLVIYTEEYDTKQDAYRREMKIKSYNSGEGFKVLLSNVNNK
ncbi:MAG: GIY-YIG nuclease family protein [Patescibacteria group bacterium]|jgi:putative endonuclease|nr:GIY-YIG nuclease family protein [Patescibacteria group bacterium]